MLEHEGTSADRETTSDAQGFYQFLGLTFGSYTLEAEQPGFKRYVSSYIGLTTDENVRADILLELGEVTETVEVRASAALVDSRSSELSALVDDRRIVDLPLRNRNVIAFVELLPGVTQVRAPANTDLGNSRDGPRMSVNGGRQNQTYLTLNGTYFVHPSRNTGFNVPPPDAVQEIRMKTANYSAEEGRNSGAIVSVVTRSGSNEFHGSAWEFHRNSALNARSFFQREKASERQNQFGAAGGGPIVKNKLFVFGSYEGIRDRRQASTVSSYPPTQAERAGDFSDVSKQLVDPFTGGAPFPGNQIPVSRFDPAAKNLLQFLPVPPPDGRLTGFAPAPRNSHLIMFRGDWNISDSQTLFGHYYLNQNRVSQESLWIDNIPGWMGVDQRVRDQNAGLNHTYIFGPTLINQLTLGFTRSASLNSPNRTRTNAELGINMPDYQSGGATQFRTSGRFDLRSRGDVIFVSNNYDISENLSWVKGRHTLKFGFQYLDLSFYQTWSPGVEFSLNGSRSGDALADFMLGAYRSVNVRWGTRENDDHSSFAAGYFQDDFKLTDRVTLNFGLRYELPTPWVDKYDRLSTVSFDPNAQSKVVPHAPPAMLFVGDVPRGLYETDRNNFAPRFGFAWDLLGNGRTVVRGAWGLFYDTLNADTTAQTNQPYAGGAKFFNGRLSDPLAGETPPPVTPDIENFEFVLPIGIIATSPDMRTPYVQQWNLTVERQFGRNTSVQAAYVGKESRKLALRPHINAAIYQPGVDENGNPLSTLKNANQRVPFLPGVYSTSLTMAKADFNASYHAAQLKLNKRFADGFSVLASYTFGKSIDDTSVFTMGARVANPYDRRADRGRSQFDSTHTLAVSWMWTPLPAKPGWFGRLAGDWTLTGIHRVRSGYPLTFLSGDDRALDGATGKAQHPDLLRDPGRSHSSRDDMLAKFFDTDAFAVPETGKYGSAGRGIVSGPAFVNTDLAILKDFMLSEPLRLQFRAEFFNLFNQVNFTSVRTNMRDKRFGEINNSAGGRGIQFGLKLIW